MLKHVSVVLAVLCLAPRSLPAEGPTWIEIGETVYGAKPDERGPIGGGKGYVNITTKGDYTVKNLDALLDALAKAKAGQVVFIPGETEIDLMGATEEDFIEGLRIRAEIFGDGYFPDGVTIEDFMRSIGAMQGKGEELGLSKEQEAELGIKMNKHLSH